MNRILLSLVCIFSTISVLAQNKNGDRRPSSFLADSVLLVPANYPDDSSLIKVRNVQVKRHHTGSKADLNTQLAKLRRKAGKRGGNVFFPERIYGAGEDVVCIKGEACYCRDLNGLRARLEQWKKSRTDPRRAYVIIYTPRMRHGKVQLIVDDHEVLLLPFSKQVVVLNGNTEYKIASDNNTLTLHVEPGHCYYVKATHDRRHTFVTLMDNFYGEIETGCIGFKKSGHSGDLTVGGEEADKSY